MSCAICLTPYNATGRPIENLWDQMTAFEKAPSMKPMNYPPHITYTMYDDAVCSQIYQTVRDIFKDMAQVRITFDAIGFFDVSPLVLWAAPREPAALHQVHTEIHARVNPRECRENYRPDNWVPHCTLATQVPDELRAQALAFAATPIEPFEIIFDTIDFVDYATIEVIETLKLIG